MIPRRDRQSSSQGFMDYVQLHERTWGTDSYAGRPDLAAILESPVVVFWQVESKDDRLVVTLHEDLSKVEAYFYKLIFRTTVQSPKRRLVRIYRDKKRIMVRNVHIEFVESDD
jgi:hypothetical protein